MHAFLITEYIGIASAAFSGFLFGIRCGCDWLGVFVAAFLTALGGGILRDLIVGREVYSFTHYIPVLIVIFVMILAILLKYHRKKRQNLEKKFIFILTDAIDVISFSIVGAMIACEFGLNIFGAVMVAFCNGVGGGILRDVLLNEVPWFLKTGLYGTISMIVGFVYYFIHLLDFANIYSIMILFCAGVVFRLVAYYKNWHLPQIKYRE